MDKICTQHIEVSAGVRTVGPELVPVDEHVGELALVTVLQVVLELGGGRADVVDHELHGDIKVLRKVRHILPGAFLRVHLLQQLNGAWCGKARMVLGPSHMDRERSGAAQSWYSC